MVQGLATNKWHWRWRRRIPGRVRRPRRSARQGRLRLKGCPSRDHQGRVWIDNRYGRKWSLTNSERMHARMLQQNLSLLVVTSRHFNFQTFLLSNRNSFRSFARDIYFFILFFACRNTWRALAETPMRLTTISSAFFWTQVLAVTSLEWAATYRITRKDPHSWDSATLKRTWKDSFERSARCTASVAPVVALVGQGRGSSRVTYQSHQFN